MHMKKYLWFFALLLVCNSVDLVCTVLFLEKRIAYETNPVMAALYSASPMYFVAAKVALVTLGGAILYAVAKTSAKGRRLAAAALLFYAILYAAVAAYQITMLFHWLSAG
jgi:hypothetical protein